MEMIDVEELIMYYKDSEKNRINISKDLEYQQALFNFTQDKTINKNFLPVIYLDVSEKSRLFVRELEQSKVQVKNVDNSTNFNKKFDEPISTFELFQKEIMAKKHALQAELEKEKLDKERREKERQEKERLEKERLEREEQERLIENEKQLEMENLEMERLEYELAKQQAKEEAEKRESELRKEIININSVRQSIVLENNFNEEFNLTLSKIINENLENAKKDILNSTLKTTNDIINKMKRSSISNNNSIHLGVRCDGCNMAPIIGHRYKCTVCLDFDYCDDCEEKLSENHSHPFVKLRKPSDSRVEVRCTIENIKKPENSQQIETINVEEKKPNFLQKVKDTFKKIPEKFVMVEDIIRNKFKPAKADEVERRKYKHLIAPTRQTYLLENVNDTELLDALVKTKGNIEEALPLLFKD